MNVKRNKVVEPKIICFHLFSIFRILCCPKSSFVELPNISSRKLGWILSRDITFSQAPDARVAEVLRNNDLDREFIRKTSQNLAQCRAETA